MIDFPDQEDYTKIDGKDADRIRIVNIPVKVFASDALPNGSMTENEPAMTAITANGESDLWTPGENVGARYNVCCNFFGTYEDAGCGGSRGRIAGSAKQ